MSQRSVQDLLDRVRQVLQDQAKDNYRYPTGDLIGYTNDAVLEARRLRPDLFIGKYRVALPQVIPGADPETTDFTVIACPVPDSCFVAVCNYVAGSAEIRDDEYAVDGRAQTFIQSFARTLMGGQ